VIRSRIALGGRAGLAAALAVALAAALLSACGGIEPGAAAVIGDRRISVSDVQSATADIKETFPGQDVAPQQVLFFLISGPYIVDAAAKANVGVSTAESRQAMTAAIAAAAAKTAGGTAGASAAPAAEAQPPSDAGVAVYQANTAISNIGTLDQTRQKAAVDTIKAELAAAHVTVNPRYGTFDPVNLTIGAADQNWIAKATPSPAVDSGPAGSAGGTPSPAAS
jgi:peptidyl-prolyl cis-trans isomerase SurA